jgi:actin-related protein
MECVEAIISYIVDILNILCSNYHVLIITPQKFSDKVNVQFLNMLLVNEKFQFESVTLINQTLMSLYSYNTNVGIVANLSEKIDIVPYCNGRTY